MAIPGLNDKGRMAANPLSPEAKITVERRGQIVLIGVNWPQICNRFEPDAFFGLAKAYYDFDNDPSLRAAVFFGHCENFSRGIDVDAFAPLARTGRPFAVNDGMLDPFARTQEEPALVCGQLVQDPLRVEGVLGDGRLGAHGVIVTCRGWHGRRHARRVSRARDRDTGPTRGTA
jgi:hypothetical protein